MQDLKSVASRRLQIALAKDEGNQKILPPSTREELVSLLKSRWSENPSDYLYAHDGQRNMFVIQAEGEAFEIHIRVQDKFGLLGLMGKPVVLELDFGLLPLEDVELLLKLFYEDNYPTLRSLHRQMKS